MTFLVSGSKLPQYYKGETLATEFDLKMCVPIREVSSFQRIYSTCMCKLLRVEDLKLE